MLRTNSKKAKENIRAYIMQDSDYIQERAEYDGRTIDPANFKEIAGEIWGAFMEERGNRPDLMRFYKTMYNAFEDWGQGLALGGLFLYYYNTPAVDVLGDILEETEEERSKYTEEQAESLLTRLIYREITSTLRA